MSDGLNVYTHTIGKYKDQVYNAFMNDFTKKDAIAKITWRVLTSSGLPSSIIKTGEVPQITHSTDEFYFKPTSASQFKYEDIELNGSSVPSINSIISGILSGIRNEYNDVYKDSSQFQPWILMFGVNDILTIMKVESTFHIQMNHDVSALGYGWGQVNHTITDTIANLNNVYDPNNKLIVYFKDIINNSKYIKLVGELKSLTSFMSLIDKVISGSASPSTVKYLLYYIILIYSSLSNFYNDKDKKSTDALEVPVVVSGIGTLKIPIFISKLSMPDASTFNEYQTSMMSLYTRIVIKGLNTKLRMFASNLSQNLSIALDRVSNYSGNINNYTFKWLYDFLKTVPNQKKILTTDANLEGHDSNTSFLNSLRSALKSALDDWNKLLTEYNKSPNNEKKTQLSNTLKEIKAYLDIYKMLKIATYQYYNSGTNWSEFRNKHYDIHQINESNYIKKIQNTYNGKYINPIPENHKPIILNSVVTSLKDYLTSDLFQIHEYFGIDITGMEKQIGETPTKSSITTPPSEPKIEKPADITTIKNLGNVVMSDSTNLRNISNVVVNTANVKIQNTISL